MLEADHFALLIAARASKSMVVISGYDSPLYNDVLSDWHRVELPARTYRNRPRVEVLWLNEAAWAGRRADV